MTDSELVPNSKVIGRRVLSKTDGVEVISSEVVATKYLGMRAGSEIIFADGSKTISHGSRVRVVK